MVLENNAMMKQKQQGFTIIELLVVIAIMGTIASILVVNYNRQGGVRSVKIAQSQLSTNIRKIQSYILSSRNISGNGVTNPPHDYAISLFVNGTSYDLQGIDSVSNTVTTLETIKLPQGVVISQIQIANPANNVNQAVVAYASPYGKMYVIGKSTDCASDFPTANRNPSCLLQLADRQVTITLTDQKSQLTKTVTLYGVSGTVSSSK